MKRWMFSFVVIMIVSLVTAACGKGNVEPAKATTDQKVANEPAELTIYSTSRDSQDSFNDRYGNALRKKFPNYKINYIQRGTGTDLADLLTAGTKIDIEWDSLGSFPGSIIQNELGYDMTDLIKKHNVDMSRFEPTLLDVMKQLSKGGYYGLPVYNERMAIYYNKDIFDKFGVAYPKDGMTWEELTSVALKLNREDGDRMYAGFAHSVNPLFLQNQFSLPLVDSKTVTSTINSEKWKYIINTLIVAPAASDTYRKMVVINKKPLDLTAFTKEQSLAMFTSSTVLPLVLPDDMKKVNWDVVSYPTFKELPGVGPQSYPGYFGITKLSDNKDAAMEVIKFLTSDEYQLEMSKRGIMSSLKTDTIQKALGQESAFKGKNYGAFSYNKFPAIAEKTLYESQVPVLGNYIKNVGKLITGEMDINTLLRTAEEETNKVLKPLVK